MPFDEVVAARYLATLRYLRPGQIAARARFLILKQVYRRWPARFLKRFAAAGRGDGWRLVPLDAAELPVGGDGLTADDVLRGRFVFLNRAIEFGRRVDWSAPGVSRLWRYHLHYFEVARPLAAAWLARREDRFVRGFLDLARDHERAVPFGHPDGWHPFPVATRVVNSLLALGAMRESLALTAEELRRCEAWVATQAEFVRHHLEYDVLGNHLLRNLTALVCAGAAGEGPLARGWLRVGLDHLERQLHEQILPDGGHYERSPHYHVLVLDDLRDMLGVFAARGGEAPRFLVESEQRMTAALSSMVHPDGGLALFNDGARTTRPRRGAWPPAEPSNSLAQTGFLTLANQADDWLVLDVGEACPPFLPAHAHCDLLSFELSLCGQPVFVNSGTFEYEEGDWRRFFRSTHAHTTLTVDGADQHDAWGAFRLGRRSRPLQGRTAETTLGPALVGTHAGFTTPPVRVTHTRAVVLTPEREWLVVDRLVGSGDHRVDSYLHLHPRIAIELRDGMVVLGDTGFALVPQGFDEIRTVVGRDQGPRNGWFAPDFGRLEPRTTLHLSATRQLPALFGVAIVPVGRAADAAWQARLAPRLAALAEELGL